MQSDINELGVASLRYRDNASVPGCGENSVDNRILGILGAHQENVLCGEK